MDTMSPLLIFDFDGQRRRFARPVDVVVATRPSQVRPALRAVERAARRGLYAAGYVAYEAAPAFDRALVVRPGDRIPLLWFGLFDRPLPAAPAEPPGAFTVSDWLPSVDGAAYDAATSPRRGGVRFVDPEARAAADAIAADPRSTGQIALDTFVELIRIGTAADPGTLLGAKRHAVRVLVTARDLATGVGAGFLDGQTEAVSLETVERHICDTGTLPVEFDQTNRDPLRLGREQRLYTSRQREALVARDGGCRFPDCDRPPSWTEAHHSIPWHTGGPTDIDTGILLCRHHHHLVHDNGWGIEPDTEHGFVAIPPPDIDPHRAPIPMPSRSRALTRLART